MEIKNICTKKTYTKNGTEKTLWLNVGCLKTLDDGRQFIELNMYPNQGFYVFEQREKPQSAPTNQPVEEQEIPF